MSDLQRINNFLAGVDLARYRQKYQHIKLVELDLPKNIRALNHLYQEYWTDRSTFPDFESFYQIYATDLEEELEEFRETSMFSEETFYRGLPARIYRTWASLLTQIQGGYAAEHLYGHGSVVMNTELDYAGIDIRILFNGESLNIQIKKETVSREVRTPWQGIKRGQPIITVSYEVPGCDPLTPTGKASVPFNRWQEKWAGKLERLDNGFIIFLPDMFSMDYIRTP